MSVRRIVRRVFLVIAFLAAAVIPPVGCIIGTTIHHVASQQGVPAGSPLPEVSPPARDRTRRTAVVVTGRDGAEMTDFLIPYETLAATGELDVYVVAPEKRVIPLANAAFRDGGLDLVPHYSLAELDREIERVDVIVIPFLPTFADGGERELVPWIKRQAERGALIVSICAGSEVLAATGLLDGQRATTHPNFFARLERTYPAVTWVRDVRFVETERTISSGAIASGMDATLAAIRRLLGRAAADKVARELGYAHAGFLDAPAYQTGFDMRAMLRAMVWPARTELGALIYDGIGEQALGSLFDTYPTTLGIRVTSIAETRRVVRSRHGLLLLPRFAADAAPQVERLLVPGTPDAATIAVAGAWRARTGNEVSYVHAGRTGFAYDGPIVDLAARYSRATATAVATNLNYPIDHLELEGPAFEARIVVVPVLWSVLGLALLLQIRRWLRARRARSAEAKVLGVEHGGVRLERERTLDHVA